MIIHCNAQQEGNGWRISGYCTSHQFFHQREFAKGDPGELRKSIGGAGRGNLSCIGINNKSCCQQSDLWQQLFKLQLSFIPRTKIRNADKHIIRFQIADDRSIPGNRRFSGIILWCLLHCRLPREECRILFRQDFHRVTASSALCCSFRRSVQRKCGSGL